MSKNNTEYIFGTKRARAPEVTFDLLQAHLERCGISRCADVTGLDSLGVPVFVVVRPLGRALQASQGKGARAIDAKVSGIMESIETHYWENPLVPFLWASHDELRSQGELVVDPRELPLFRKNVYYAPDYRIHWVRGENLISQESAWLPAASIYLMEPTEFESTTNGLASGNNVQEATLHSLLEIYERDALSNLIQDGSISFDLCDVINLSTIDNAVLSENINRIVASGVELRLFRISVVSTIHTFFAFILDPNPFAKSSRVNFGAGSHLDPAIAASRAITEAAQSRLTFIHSSREDLQDAAYVGRHENLYGFVESYQPNSVWQSLTSASGPSIASDLETVITQFKSEECSELWRVILTEPDLNVAVVKVIATGAEAGAL